MCVVNVYARLCGSGCLCTWRQSFRWCLLLYLCLHLSFEVEFSLNPELTHWLHCQVNKFQGSSASTLPLPPAQTLFKAFLQIPGSKLFSLYSSMPSTLSSEPSGQKEMVFLSFKSQQQQVNTPETQEKIFNELKIKDTNNFHDKNFYVSDLHILRSLRILNPGEDMEKQASSNAHLQVQQGNTTAESHSTALSFKQCRLFYLCNPGTPGLFQSL